jgi:hypothetical protein
LQLNHQRTVSLHRIGFDHHGMTSVSTEHHFTESASPRHRHNRRSKASGHADGHIRPVFNTQSIAAFDAPSIIDGPASVTLLHRISNRKPSQQHGVSQVA